MLVWISDSSLQGIPSLLSAGDIGLHDTIPVITGPVIQPADQNASVQHQAGNHFDILYVLSPILRLHDEKLIPTDTDGAERECTDRWSLRAIHPLESLHTVGYPLHRLLHSLPVHRDMERLRSRLCIQQFRLCEDYPGGNYEFRQTTVPKRLGDHQCRNAYQHSTHHTALPLSSEILCARFDYRSDKRMKQEVITGYKTLGCDKIEPQGWTDVLLRNLADGLTGNLDEIWEDVGPDSAWLGGDGESWERGPYYLDGLIPLAALLRDARLQKKVGKWIRSVLDSQLETGYFGPSTNTDLWPRMVMMKALVTYAEIHRDEEGGVSVIHLLQSFSRYMVDVLESQPLQMWSFARAMEACPSLFWLYDETQDPIFLELAETLGKRGLDWNTFFHDFPIKKPIWEYMPWQEYVSAMDEATQDQNQPTLLERARNEEMFNLYHTSHGVNVAMALKYLVYLYRITGDTTYLRTLRAAREQLMAYHGQGNGMFGCDEHLSGPEPSQGTELCTVVELLYSLEQIIKISKDLSWIDWLEHIAYNALLTTIATDGCSHQYNQQVNQISCTVDPRQWYSNHDDSNIFGLEPNFGCCTANMHQGWPKFIQSLWLKDDSGYVCVSYAPVKVRERDVTITVTGQYPFPIPHLLSLIANVSANSPSP